MPILGIDCFSIAPGGVLRRSQLEFEQTPTGEELLKEASAQGSIVKCLVVRCTRSKCIFAHCVPCKGAGEEDFAAGLEVKDVLWLGHSQLVLKGDNGPAL